MKFFYFIFIFLLCTCFVFAYKPGEKINLTYSNITNISTSYPCFIINNSVYIYSNLSPGDYDCNITYWYNDTIIIPQQTTPSVSSGTSGGSKSGLPPNCIDWSKCVNNKTIRLCQKGNSIYNQTKSCVSEVTFKEVIQEIKNIIKNETKQEEVIQPVQTVEPIVEPKQSSPIIFVVIFVIIGLLIIGGICFGLYYFVLK